MSTTLFTHLFLGLFLSVSLCSASTSTNITKILQNYPQYSTFSSLCSKYGVAQQIDSRTTITVLVPPNSALDPVVQGLSAQSIFDILSFHVLLDYYDLVKLKSITKGTTLSTTLYQTSGLASGNEGSVNITDVKGAAHVGRSDPGADLSAVIGSEIYTNPYTISVLSVSQVLLPTGVEAPGPSPAPINLTAILSQGKKYNTFLALIKSTGVDVVLQKHDVPPGLTLFCPDDGAFNKLPKGVLANLTNAQQVALLEYHAIGSFYSSQQLSSLPGTLSTLASGSGGGNYLYSSFSQSKTGGIVIDTGFDKVPIGETLYSQMPVSVFGISTVLLPTDIFGLASISAPTPSPASSPTPASSPSPAPAFSPSPTSAPSSSSSPPAPPPDSSVSSSLGTGSPDNSANSAYPVQIGVVLGAAMQFAIAILFM